MKHFYEPEGSEFFPGRTAGIKIELRGKKTKKKRGKIRIKIKSKKSLILTLH